MVRDITAVYQALVDVLSHHRPVQRIILFGSRARGDESPRSDIDLAVEAPDASDNAWNRMWFDAHDVDTLLSVDLIRWDVASLELRQRILAEGRVLYERSQNHTELEQLRESTVASPGSIRDAN